MTRHNGKSGMEMAYLLNKLDLAQVVRCGECELRGKLGCPLGIKAFDNDNAYCSWGERKDGGE